MFQTLITCLIQLKFTKHLLSTRHCARSTYPADKSDTSPLLCTMLSLCSQYHFYVHDRSYWYVFSHSFDFFFIALIQVHNYISDGLIHAYLSHLRSKKEETTSTFLNNCIPRTQNSGQHTLPVCSSPHHSLLPSPHWVKCSLQFILCLCCCFSQSKELFLQTTASLKGWRNRSQRAGPNVSRKMRDSTFLYGSEEWPIVLPRPRLLLAQTSRHLSLQALS